MLELNSRLRLTLGDYEETVPAEPTNRLLCDADREAGVIEWYGHGTVAGLRARAVYYTCQDDQDRVDEPGGYWGCADWDRALTRVEILTDDGVPVVIIRGREEPERKENESCEICCEELVGAEDLFMGICKSCWDEHNKECEE